MVVANQHNQVNEDIEMDVAIVLSPDQRNNIYNIFLEAFVGDDAMYLNINTLELSNHVWTHFEQLFNTSNISENITQWLPEHRRAFLEAYNAHRPLGSGRRSFIQMEVPVSFVTHILMTLYH